jgi:periplasmic protein TonB
MNRQYLIPVSFAAALHVGVLFGARWEPSAKVAPEPPPTVVPDDFLAPVDLLPPEPAEVSDIVCGGTPILPPPVSPEPPVSAKPGDFVVPMPAITPTNGPIEISEIKPFSPGSPGDANRPFGPGGPSVIPSGLLDNSPRARFQSAPQYPFEAKRVSLEGDVTVEFTVDENGHVVSPRVVNSTDRVFEEATLRAVAKWRFEPGKRDGRVVRFRMAVPVVFRLNEG